MIVECLRCDEELEEEAGGVGLDGVEGDGGVGNREAGDLGGGVEDETSEVEIVLSVLCSGKGDREDELGRHPDVYALYFDLFIMLVFALGSPVEGGCPVRVPMCSPGQS